METEDIKNIMAYGESWDFPRMPIAWKKTPTIDRFATYEAASDWIPEGRGGWVQFLRAQTPERIREIAGILSAFPLNDLDSF